MNSDILGLPDIANRDPAGRKSSGNFESHLSSFCHLLSRNAVSCEKKVCTWDFMNCPRCQRPTPCGYETWQEGNENIFISASKPMHNGSCRRLNMEVKIPASSFLLRHP